MNDPKQPVSSSVKDGDFCEVTSGSHTGKSGIAKDRKVSKSGSVTITVVQSDGERFKTLAKNVVVKKSNSE